MLELLRDPLWQFIGAFFSMGALMLAFLVAHRSRRSLSYQILTRSLLNTDRTYLNGKVQLMVEGQVVESAHLVAVRIVNDGNVPLVGADLVEPLSVSFGENASIVTASIAETSPEGINVPLSYDAASTECEPALLNSGDSFSVAAIVLGFKGEVFVRGRIVGVSQIRRLMRRQSTLFLLEHSVLVLGWVWFFVGLMFFRPRSAPPSPPEPLVFVDYLIFGGLILAASTSAALFLKSVVLTVQRYSRKPDH